LDEARRMSLRVPRSARAARVSRLIFTKGRMLFTTADGPMPEHHAGKNAAETRRLRAYHTSLYSGELHCTPLTQPFGAKTRPDSAASD